MKHGNIVSQSSNVYNVKIFLIKIYSYPIKSNHIRITNPTKSICESALII